MASELNPLTVLNHERKHTMKTNIQIPTVVSATLTSVGVVTVDYDKRTSELIAGRFTAFYVFLEEVARGFLPEDTGVKRLEMAILQLDTDLRKEPLASAVANIDRANPWRFGGISALLTLGSDDARNEDFNLIAFGSPNSPGARDGYPVLIPRDRQLNICPRCFNEAILIVRDAPVP